MNMNVGECEYEYVNMNVGECEYEYECTMS